MAIKITRDMIIAEVLQIHPEVSQVLLDHGMSCLSCGLARMGTVEEGARVHDIDADALVDELNRRVAERMQTQTEEEQA